MPPQRLRFLVELIKAAGYKGWVVLLDEIELVGSYSLLQRGRSYAELSRWLGQVVGESYPGLVVVGTVTHDYASAIISSNLESKKDRDYVAAKLEPSRYREVKDRAETGMNLLERTCMPLDTPTLADVQSTVNKLREIYGAAYPGWRVPEQSGRVGGAGIWGRMRYQVRAAINEWDLLRLYPDSRPDTEGDEFRHTYEENVDLERESKDHADDNGQPPTAPPA